MQHLRRRAAQFSGYTAFLTVISALCLTIDSGRLSQIERSSDRAIERSSDRSTFGSKDVPLSVHSVPYI